MADARGNPEKTGKSPKKVPSSSQSSTSSNFSSASAAQKSREQIVEEQRKHINLIEKRLHELVRAYKATCLERDNLLAAQTKLQISQSNDPGRQGRIAELEAKLTELSVLCGQHEKERFDDAMKIQSLEDRCALLEDQLDKRTEMTHHMPSDTSPVQIPVKLRNRATQTEIKDESEEEVEPKDLSLAKSSTEMVSVETQTETNKNLKELAIVLPLPPNDEENSSTLVQDETEDFSTFANQEEQSEDLLNASTISESPPYEASPTSSSRFTFNQAQGPMSAGIVARPRNISEGETGSASVASTQGLSIFYVNELARKEIELAEAKLQSREFECALREMQWKYNVDKFKLQSKITELEKQLRSNRSASSAASSGTNFEYVRNVLLKLLVTKDKKQRQFMINALLAALDAKDPTQKADPQQASTSSTLSK